MVKRVKGSEAAASSEQKPNFARDFQLSKKAKLALGKECFVIPLGMEKGILGAEYHEVRARKDKKGAYKGFKFPSFRSVKIKCKKEEDAERDNALCGQLADAQRELFPDKDEADRRLITYARTEFYMPVLLLGSAETDPEKKMADPSKITAKTYDFAYITFPGTTWASLYNDLGEYLKEQEVIDYSLDDDELKQAIDENLSKIIIKVKCEKAKTTSIPYAKTYSFVHFGKKVIASKSSSDPEKATKMRNLITHYMNPKSPLRNKVIDFLTLFESEVDNFLLDWREDELEEYINGVAEREENMETFKKADKEQQEFEEKLEEEQQEFEEKLEEETETKKDKELDEATPTPDEECCDSIDDLTVDEDDFNWDDDDEDDSSQDDDDEDDFSQDDD